MNVYRENERRKDAHSSLQQSTDEVSELLIFDEGSLNLRNIIFAPFGLIWMSLTVVSISSVILLTLYDIQFQIPSGSRSNTHWIEVFITFCHAFYLLDLILHILHQRLGRIRITRAHRPLSWMIICIDCVSVLPLSFFYDHLIIDKSSHNINVPNLLRLNHLLRIIRLMFIFAGTIYRPGANPVLVLLVGHTIQLLIFTQILNCVWYYVMPQIYEINWMVNLKYKNVDKHNNAHMYILSETIMLATYFGSWRGSIRAANFGERLLLTIVMMSGFVLQYGLLIGKLISAFIKVNTRYFSYVTYLNTVMDFMKLSNLNEELQKRAIEYYKHGESEKESELFHTLPVSLQKEVSMDIFWEALRHSRLFSNTDIPFKRSLSIRMKSEFLLPGDLIYKYGAIKAKMVYILTGVVQVLSDEDGESPIISLSSGSVLGTPSLLMPTKSAYEVRCATFCEVHTLSMYDLYDTLKEFPDKAIQFLGDIHSRLVKARKIHHNIVLYGRTQHSVDDVELMMRHEIKWLKKRWWQIYNRHMNDVHGQDSTQQYDIDEGMDNILSALHTSAYLGLYALTAEVELKTQAVCLQTTCPWILDPTSDFIYYWQLLQFVVIFIDCYILPYYITFQRQSGSTVWSFGIVLDMFYYVDTVLQVFTAIKTKDVIVTNILTILTYRIKEATFVIDVVSIVPLSVFLLMIRVSDIQIFLLCRMNRCVRFYKIIQFLRKTERSSSFLNILMVRVIKYIILLIATIYLFIVIFFMTACFRDECYPYSWYSIYISNKVLANTYSEHMTELHATFRYVAVVFFGVGTTDAAPINILDICMFFCAVLVWYILTAFCFAEFSSTLLLKRRHQEKFRELLIELKRFMVANKMATDIRQRVEAYLCFQWDANKGSTIVSEKKLFSDASDVLKEDLLATRVKNILLQIPIFKGTNDDFVMNLSSNAKCFDLPAQSTLSSAGVRSTAMHIISKGYCRVVSHLLGDLSREREAVIGPGGYFPLVEFVHQIPSLITVETVTQCEVIVLEFSTLWGIMKLYPTVLNEIQRAVDAQQITHNIQAIRPAKRGNAMRPKTFTFQTYLFGAEERTEEERQYMEPFEKCGIFNNIRFIMLKKAIHPSSKFLFRWEASRAVFAVTTSFMTTAVYSTFIEYHQELNYLTIILDIAAYIDIYLRCHVGYYNEKGLLVTHPLYTAKRYLSHAMVIDVLACFPFNRFDLHTYFGVKFVTMDYVVLCSTRCIQLYRFVKFCNLLESDILKTYKLVYVTKIMTLIMLISHFYTIWYMFQACSFNIVDGAYESSDCTSQDSWFSKSIFNTSTHPIDIYMFASYHVITSYSSSGAGVFAPINSNFEVIVLIFRFASFLLRNWMFALVATFIAGGNVNLTVYQERMQTLVEFMKNELVEEDLVNEVIHHFEFSWLRARGTDVHRIFAKLHPMLREDVVHSLYTSAFKDVSIFSGADDSLFRVLGKNVTEMYFRKGSYIIKCNDVQNMIYFVFKGTVNAKSFNGNRVMTLTRGCVFGNFNRLKMMRHTLSMVAKINVDLLVIPSDVFHSIVSSHRRVVTRFSRAFKINSEFIVNPKHRSVHLGYMDDVSLASSVSLLGKLHILRKLLTVDTWVYKMWSVALCVVFSPMSTTLVLSQIALRLNVTYITVPIYILDVIFLSRIYLGFHTAYTEKESGILITEFTKIALRYVKSGFGFWLDLVSIIPFELLVTLIPSLSIEHYIYWFKCNRLLRVIYMFHFFYVFYNKLNVNSFARWYRLVLLLLQYVHLFACITIISQCEGGCDYFTDHVARIKSTTKTAWETMIIAMFSVVNLLTGCGFHDTAPDDIIEVIFTSIFVLASQIVIAVTIGYIASILKIRNYTISEYDDKVDVLRSFLTGRDLSKSLLNKVLSHCQMLWNRESGETLPFLLKEAPTCLLTRLMNALYGHHIRENAVFACAHEDFLRQLPAKLQRTVIFPGYYIVEKGDVDQNMYFIHSGEVEVVTRNIYYVETVIHTLEQGAVFGMDQGLYTNLPHKHIFKAKTIVDCLILHRDRWMDLLDCFPTSKIAIYEMAAKTNFKF